MERELAGRKKRQCSLCLPPWQWGRAGEGKGKLATAPAPVLKKQQVGIWSPVSFSGRRMWETAGGRLQSSPPQPRAPTGPWFISLDSVLPGMSSRELYTSKLTAWSRQKQSFNAEKFSVGVWSKMSKCGGTSCPPRLCTGQTSQS